MIDIDQNYYITTRRRVGMAFQSNDRMYILFGLMYGVFITACMLYVPLDDNGIKHMEWWRPHLAVLPIFVGVLIPLYAREILGRIRCVCYSGKNVGKHTHG